MDSRRAWLVWSVGVLAYIVAVLHRTSLGVAGLDAVERFDASASTLASFAVLQLLVYAGLQVPVGILLDRFGSRRMVLSGALLMSSGQLMLALTTGVPLAVGARVLVGAGDALTFISVLRLVSAWFPPRRSPVVTQLTGLLGQLGQIGSAVPLLAVLNSYGWTTAFAGVAAVGLLVALLVAVTLQDTPPGAPAPYRSPSAAQVRAALVSAWRHPGTRLGLWTHFTTQFSGTVFVLLWGYPFLVSAQELPPRQASALLTLIVLAGIVTGPTLGRVVARHPLRRSSLVLGIVAATALTWTVVLALPGPAPLWLLVVLVLVLAAGGPASMVGFDFARTFNPANRLGTATGIVNVGGFVASLTTIFLIGVVLDLLGGGGRSAYSLEDFRVALSVQYLVWAVGLVGILRTRTLVRRRLAGRGIVVPPLREALRRERELRRQRRRGPRG